MARKKKNQRADGRLQKCISFKGRKYYVYAYNREDLERKAYEKKQELERGVVEHDSPTFAGYYAMWVKAREGVVKEATLRIQQCHFNAVSKVDIGGVRFADYRLKDIKADDIRTVQKVLLANGNRTQTVNDKIAFISHIFNDAIKEQYISYNPCVVVKPLKRTEKPARETIHRALTVEETAIFFEAAKNSYYYDVYRMLILTGMRIGELGALYTSDIYDNAIHIERTVTRQQDGSNKIGDNPKTWSGKRIIPMNDAIVAVIEHQKEINRMFDGNVRAIHDTIFKARERGILLATPVDRDIKRICRRCGIDIFTAHAFRDTFATRAIEQGIDPRTIQELLGHSDYGLTMNLYGHVVDTTLENAMNKIYIAL